MTTTFYLIRHGETDWNLRSLILGQSQVSLNDTGRQQAKKLAERLAGLPLAAIYTSDLPRALETAQILGAMLPSAQIFPDARLREKHAGHGTGLIYADAQAAAPAYVAASRLDPLNARPPGGETFAELAARVDAALTGIAEQHPEQTVGIVTHGGPLRAILFSVLGLTAAQLERFAFDNCSFTVLEWGPAPRFRSINNADG